MFCLIDCLQIPIFKGSMGIFCRTKKNIAEQKFVGTRDHGITEGFLHVASQELQGWRFVLCIYVPYLEDGPPGIVSSDRMGPQFISHEVKGHL